MKKHVLVTLLLVAASMAAPAAAQGTGGFQFGFTGGVSLPNGTTSDTLDDGYHGGIVLNYELPALPLGIRVDGDYRHFSAKATIPGVTGSAEVFDGNANLVVRIRIIAVKVYALGGGGLYNVKLKAENAGGWVCRVPTPSSAGTRGRRRARSRQGLHLRRGPSTTRSRWTPGKFKFVAVSGGILF